MSLLPLAIIQSLLLAGGQVFLKLALERMEPFDWSWHFWSALLTNWHFALCGLFYGAGTFLWFYIIKHFPFSMAYPIVSITKWAGVLLIMAGCYLIAK